MMRQLIRYGVVGIASNGVLYALYLVMTRYGIGPKLAMTIAYGAGVVQTFAFNRRWTFEHRGAVGSAFSRYVATYAIGYGTNLVALVMLVDHAGLPHRWVQAAMIVCIAALVFLLQKFWVFHVPPRNVLAPTDRFAPFDERTPES